MDSIGCVMILNRDVLPVPIGEPADKGKDLRLFTIELHTLDSFRSDPGLLPTTGLSNPAWKFLFDPEDLD